MKILMVSEHCCARVIKEGVALMKAGMDVAFMQQRHANPHFKSMMPSIIYYKTPDQLVDKILNMTDVDIIHVHNEPDWMGHVCKQYRPDLPVVFDAHDLFSVRIGESLPDETKSFEMCDAFVYPSKAYMESAVELHNIHNKPNIVLYSMANQEFICHNPLPRIHAIVYQGGLRIKEKENDVPEQYRYHQYRDYRQLFSKLTQKGVPIIAHCANPDVVDEYAKTGAMIFPPVEYSYLLQSLTRYSWGLAGGPRKHPQWDAAMPHKLFEYLAAGIPVITLNAAEVSEFVEEQCIGISVKDHKGIREVYEDVNSELYRMIVEAKRERFTMEYQIDKLIKLYMELI